MQHGRLWEALASHLDCAQLAIHLARAASGVDGRAALDAARGHQLGAAEEEARTREGPVLAQLEVSAR